MWSIGCIFAEMATKVALFRGDSEIDQIFRIFRFVYHFQFGFYLMTTMHHYWDFSILATPMEEIRSGVIKIPCFITQYPNYTENRLAKILADYMDEGGIKILQVWKVLTFSKSWSSISVKWEFFQMSNFIYLKFIGTFPLLLCSCSKCLLTIRNYESRQKDCWKIRTSTTSIDQSFQLVILTEISSFLNPLLPFLHFDALIFLLYTFVYINLSNYPSSFIYVKELSFQNFV